MAELTNLCTYIISTTSLVESKLYCNELLQGRLVGWEGGVLQPTHYMMCICSVVGTSTCRVYGLGWVGGFIWGELVKGYFLGHRIRDAWSAVN